MDRDPPLYPKVYPSPQIMQKEAAAMEAGYAGQTSIMVPPPNQHQLLLGPENTITTCIFCHASIKTAVKYTNTTRTHIAGALWCMACCLCCVPYASDSSKNSDHYCPNCQRYLGTYEK